MSMPSWINAFERTLKRISREPGDLAKVYNLRKVPVLPRIAIVGVGHELRGDDAAGLIAVRRLKEKLAGRPEACLVIDAGSAPENHTGALRRFRPELVVFVDAALQGAEPGRIGWFGPGEITGAGGSTHTLPLQVLGGYLSAELDCQIGVIGIQPAGTGIDAPLSPPSDAAVDEIVNTLSRILETWRK